ncbi:glyoxalase [Sphingobacterium oryzagri]|uniref:Glyoxalase n=1 Tax=Sphingobacterium oryzagri TaxID=3025669 RepID=A0ABY7WMN7_9SPHI|nr:glyoxalase [Sphingobacterium sp. KACC 22765]WDF70275.1 glyoxalase [Sphingobacterium sp. KACC 22765]
MEINFSGGVNMAMKIPPEKYEETVAFYRDILLLDVEEVAIDHPGVTSTHRLTFGASTLWLDCVPDAQDAQIWLEVLTPDVERATRYLETNGIHPQDELEEISPSMHWIKDPAGNVLLLKNK